MASENQKRRLNSLPLELIFDILTWLAVEDVLRCRCVCKQWYSITKEHRFVVKQRERGAESMDVPFTFKKHIKREPDIIIVENFKHLRLSNGLCLDMSLTNSQLCCLRNPATRQVLKLPVAHKGTWMVDFAYDISNNMCKVVSFYRGGQTDEVGCEIFTVGVDQHWRPLKHPNHDVLKQGKLFYREGIYHLGVDNGISHCAEFIKDGEDLEVQVHTLDMKRESFTTAILPRGVFSDLNKLFMLTQNWYLPQLSVAEMGDDNLAILDLDYSTEIWDQRKWVIPLGGVKEYLNLKDEIVSVEILSDELRLATEAEVIYCDFEGKSFSFHERSEVEEPEFWCLSSLIALEGMKPESKEDVRLPRRSSGAGLNRSFLLAFSMLFL